MARCQAGMCLKPLPKQRKTKENQRKTTNCVLYRLGQVCFALFELLIILGNFSEPYTKNGEWDGCATCNRLGL